MAERLYRVRGRVQGVGFRWWTRGVARQLGVTGTVRNLADGSVEVRARGDEPALATLRESIGQGPPGAAVTSIDEEPAEGVETRDFEVVR